MPSAAVNGLELEYESFGDPAGTPLLLVMGLAYQMIEWDDAACRALAGHGFWVTRFDNRDVGLSTHLDHLGTPDLLALLSGQAAPPYTLDDMAGDAAGLLDHLGIAAAHVVGVSMGGMIAQLLAVNHTPRVLSLTSIMSTVGGPGVVDPGPEMLMALMAVPGPTRQDRIEHSLALRRRIFGGGMSFDEPLARARAERAVDRAYHPEGALRQFAAIATAPDRTAALARLTMPALIVHGEEDPLVPPANAAQLAAAMPRARLLMIPGMGHNIPPSVWPVVLDAILEVTSAPRPAPPG